MCGFLHLLSLLEHEMFLDPHILVCFYGNDQILIGFNVNDAFFRECFGQNIFLFAKFSVLASWLRCDVQSLMIRFTEQVLIGCRFSGIN